jgi:hypothetical protein
VSGTIPVLLDTLGNYGITVQQVFFTQAKSPFSTWAMQLAVHANSQQ